MHRPPARTQIADLTAQVNRQDGRITNQGTQVTNLANELNRLTDRVAKLENQN